MKLPALTAWEGTRAALHQVSLVIGAIRVACSEPLPHDLQFSLEVTAGGLSTSELRCGGALHIDFEALQLTCRRGDCDVFSLNFLGHSQVSLMRQLLAALADFGCIVQPSMKTITSDSQFDIDSELACAYWKTLSAMFAALERFRATLGGGTTPLVLWPHHFDLAFIWFATEGRDEQRDPQIAYGFAPNSPGLARPYVYAYAWSEPTGYLNLPLAFPARAIAEEYTGLYSDYDKLRELEPFDAAVVAMLTNYHQLAAAQLR